jgi:hypothetical protein
LIETGTPSIGDSGLAFFQRFSEALAAPRAESASITESAFTRGLRCSARFSTAFIVSTGEALPLA